MVLPIPLAHAVSENIRSFRIKQYLTGTIVGYNLITEVLKRDFAIKSNNCIREIRWQYLAMITIFQPSLSERT
ncbi:MAG TPA: hypothetical protein PLA65_02425 [Spirochaetota bacterium]|nr:hypothetical protein [Spirochaetota bacterium]